MYVLSNQIWALVRALLRNHKGGEWLAESPGHVLTAKQSSGLDAAGIVCAPDGLSASGALTVANGRCSARCKAIFYVIEKYWCRMASKRLCKKNLLAQSCLKVVVLRVDWFSKIPLGRELNKYPGEVSIRMSP